MQTNKQQQSAGNPAAYPSPVNSDFRAGGEEERWPEDPQAAEFDQEAAIEREREVQEAEDADIVEDDRPGHVISSAAGAPPEDNDEVEDEEEDDDDEELNYDDLGDEEEEENDTKDQSV
ncbi:hypothetical protein [Chitinophaga sp. YIM B06452]|uniref:hypothetical protein n=1 Tax=Chitinophaga sp. YIM B06452 TaxID=3082158 RepID=UPI0031FEFC5D